MNSTVYDPVYDITNNNPVAVSVASNGTIVAIMPVLALIPFLCCGIYICTRPAHRRKVRQLEQRKKFIDNRLVTKKLDASSTETIWPERTYKKVTPFPIKLEKPNSSLHTVRTECDENDIENPAANEQSIDQHHHHDASPTNSSLTTSQQIIGIEECIICFQTYKDGDIIAFSEDVTCLHYTHVDCIKEWLIDHNSCPSCRREYFEISTDEQDI